MFKHTVTYKDFNGTDRKEDLYFHLSLPEVTRLEAEIGKPLDQHIKQLTEDQQLNDLLQFLEKIMLGSYGQKTNDGKSFYKSQEIRQAFEYSNAYAELFEEMMTKPDLARKFGENVADNGKVRKNKVAPALVKSEPTQAPPVTE